MIYAVEILDQKFVKIGFSDSNNAEARIASLQTGCPYEIKELFCTNGSLRQEKALHASLTVAFGRIRIPIPPNEWYPGKVQFFREFLSELEFGPNVGLGFLERYNPAIKQPGQREGKTDTSPILKWPLK